VWKDGLYPKGGQTEIAAGLVWLMLGSPSTASRWRAAHSIRCLARFGKWGVVDALVGKLHSTDAHPYQAPELSFYFLHARLWLLLAIARIAMDHPRNVAKYADMLKAIAFDRDVPHVLLRHFAAQALLACVHSGSIVLSDAAARALETVNESPFPKKRTKARPHNSFYQSRPASMPEPHPAFYLDYDFEKYDVTSVSDIFDRSRWETEDAITAWVRKYDQKITSMHENGGRTTRGRERQRGTNSRHHLYGQQLGWHALYLVAGEFLAKYPVGQRPYDDDNSWREWLKRELLTRKDGMWLADGIDRPPLDAQVNICEKGEKGVVLTGDRRKLLALLNIGTSITENLVVGGDWHSVDNISIYITSALIPPRGANKLALQLSREEPFQAWLPCAEEYEDGAEFSRYKNETYTPWIVWPSTEARLDEGDPLGVVSVVRRLHFTKAVNLVASIKTTDTFKRTWTDSEGKLAARSEVWERNRTHDEEYPISGERLICSTDFLKNVLEKQRKELLLLVILRRYDKGFGSQKSQYWHTTAVIRVKQSLDFEFFRGVVNELHVMKY